VDCFAILLRLQPIEILKGTEKFLKVPLRGTFKNFSGFYNSAKRCNCYITIGKPITDNFGCLPNSMMIVMRKLSEYDLTKVCWLMSKREE